MSVIRPRIGLGRRVLGTAMLTGLSGAYKVVTGLERAIHPTPPFDMAHICQATVPKPPTAERDTLQRRLMLAAWPVARYLCKVPLTPRDSQAICRERERQLTYLHDKAVAGAPMESLAIDTPERRRFRDQLVDHMLHRGSYDRNRIAYYIVGLPAVGKSTISDPIAAREHALVIDGDDIREHLPEWKTDQPMTYVDAEKTMLRQRIIDQAVQEGDNLILSGVPSGNDKIARTLKQLKENGYTVHLIGLSLPVDQAIERTVGRFHDTGRYVEPITEYLNAPEVETEFKALKQSDLVDTWRQYSTDVPRGQPPILLGEGS